jgi:VanZ family protein
MEHNRLARYGPLMVWAALIFIGSTDVLSVANTGGVITRALLWLFPNLSEGTLKLLHFLSRKSGHLTEYAIFAWLTARAFRTSSRELLRNRWFWASLLLVVVYALSDEFHQSFYPSRTASIYDSMIDSFGGFVALLIVWLRGKTRKRRHSPKDFKSSVVV